jgi:hypothetical protein
MSLLPKQRLFQWLVSETKHVPLPPKRPMSAYLLFAKESFPSAYEKFNSHDGKDKMKLTGQFLGRQWQALQDKEAYLAKQEKLKEAYEQASKDYLKNLSLRDSIFLHEQFKIGKQLKKRSVRKPVPDARIVSRVPSAYLCFVKSVYEASPSKQAEMLSGSALEHNLASDSVLLSTAWAKMSDNEKAVYEKKSLILADELSSSRDKVLKIQQEITEKYKELKKA